VTPVLASVIGVILLLGTLAFAVIRPKGLPEAVAAVPAAGIVLALGLISGHGAGDTVNRLGSTIGFLAAVLVIAHLCDFDGVFRWLGAVIAARSRADSTRLLVLVLVVASPTAAALSLDATVILLTPAVLATIKRLQVKPVPHGYATAHLSNTASLVLPISNLTNLLACQASGLSFVGFAGLMSGPWLVATGLEYLVFRAIGSFRRNCSSGCASRAAVHMDRTPPDMHVSFGDPAAGEGRRSSVSWSTAASGGYRCRIRWAADRRLGRSWRFIAWCC